MLGLSFDARHDHLKGDCKGALTFDRDGVRYDGSKHKFAWKYEDIQRLELAPKRVRILTYEDRKWRLGADREVTLEGAGFEAAYPFLSQRLDQRFVARLAEPSGPPLWEAPAKLRHRTGGAQGRLIVAADRIVFDAGRDSRTWRYPDIDNLSHSGPFDLTVTTHEGAFRFQLKRAIEEDRYDELWRNLFNAKTQRRGGNHQ